MFSFVQPSSPPYYITHNTHMYTYIYFSTTLLSILPTHPSDTRATVASSGTRTP